jgi:membrane-bound lytic murein transglycosylase D
MIFRFRFLVSFLLALLLFAPLKAPADESRFPVFPDLEKAVEFWRVVFTRYSTSELVFHDPLDPMRIYKVVEVGENNRTRRFIDGEKKKILAERGIKDKERIRAQRGVKERFASGLKLSRKYLGQMQQIFREKDLPIELAYLPLVESSFNVRARSRYGAVGLWQFMRSTGRRYLRIGRGIDERMDPLESTRAAARLLKENYEHFGNWPLAITAYNHGRRGILRAVKELGTTDLSEIIQRYESRSFGFASKSFYAEFVAALDVAQRSEEFFPNLEYHPPFPLEKIEVKQVVPVAALLRFANTPRDEFLDWNLALRSNITSLPKGYRIKVPPERLDSFVSAYRRVKDTPWIPHRVKRGQTLSHIASLYGVSVRKIQQFNGLENVHLITVGQRLKIPRR